MIGARFGSLVALAYAGRTANRQPLWSCRCECGLVILARGDGLTSGRTTRCLSCVRRTHGHYKADRASPTYTSWRGMHKRCSDRRNASYRYYGALGVTVCERWTSFENFLADMEERPPGTSIDRFPDAAGNYEPGNCRWASPTEQAANRRRRAA